MQIELVYKRLQARDLDQFSDLIRVFEDVFEMKNLRMPGKDYLRRLLSKPDFIVFVAILKDEVIGGLTAYTLPQYYSEKPLAYIFDLAVLQKYQRQGIGRGLIDAINDYCRAQGYEEVFVQADRIEQYAVDFYRSTHPSEEEDVLHFYYTLDKKHR